MRKGQLILEVDENDVCVQNRGKRKLLIQFIFVHKDWKSTLVIVKIGFSEKKNKNRQDVYKKRKKRSHFHMSHLHPLRQNKRF